MERIGPMSLLRRALGPALAVALFAAVPASAGILMPEAGGGSPPAEKTRTLYGIIGIIGIIVFVGVEAVLFWCLVKYRAKKGLVAAQIHGNTRLEIGWTVGAAVILVFLTIATFVMLPGIKNPAASSIDANGNPVAANAAFAATDQDPPPGGESMNIDVIGHQYVWQFKYPGEENVQGYTDMYVPVGMTITLDITSVDVQHSWWIPALAGKQDALPGYTNKSWFKVTEAGEWKGQCAELCGRNHANMYARVIALPFDEWQAWYDRAAADLKAAREAAAAGREELEAQEGPAATSGAGGEENTNSSSGEG